MNELEAIKDAIERSFSGYLRICRSGGMPKKLSDQVEASFQNFSRLYMVETLAEAMLAVRKAQEASTPSDT